MQADSLFICGTEYHPTNEQWEECQRIDEAWKRECGAIYESCEPHVPGVLDGNDAGLRANMAIKKYLDELEEILRG